MRNYWAYKAVWTGTRDCGGTDLRESVRAAAVAVVLRVHGRGKAHRRENGRDWSAASSGRDIASCGSSNAFSAHKRT